MGVCWSDIVLNKKTCCAGIDRAFPVCCWFETPCLLADFPLAGETCTTWYTWSQVLGLEHVAARATSQYAVYVLLAVSKPFLSPFSPCFLTGVTRVY
jgi:hypothetical protein